MTADATGNESLAELVQTHGSCTAPLDAAVEYLRIRGAADFSALCAGDGPARHRGEMAARCDRHRAARPPCQVVCAAHPRNRVALDLAGKDAGDGAVGSGRFAAAA